MDTPPLTRTIRIPGDVVNLLHRAKDAAPGVPPTTAKLIDLALARGLAVLLDEWAPAQKANQ